MYERAGKVRKPDRERSGDFRNLVQPNLYPQVQVLVYLAALFWRFGVEVVVPVTDALLQSRLRLR